AAGYRGGAIPGLQRQGGQPSRRRAVQDPRALREGERREVARALDRARRRLPVPDVTPGVRAYRRIGDDAARGPGARVVVEPVRVEMDYQDLVEPRIVADDPGCRVHRKWGEAPPGRRQILARDRRCLA